MGGRSSANGTIGAGDGAPEVNIFRVGQCCDSFGEQAYVDYRECVLAADALSCELLVECEEGGFGGTQNEGGDTDDGTDPTDAGTAATAGDTDAAPGADDEDKSSCAVGRGNQGWTLLGLFALLPFARRRRFQAELGDRRRPGRVARRATAA